MALSRRIFKLKGVVQHYSWGGYEFIPRLLEIENAGNKPFAEYWLGAHPNHSAFIENGNAISLNALILKNATEVLGNEVANQFGSLPYLLKVLDVRQMLSIQVHPSKESAEKGFDEEEEKGIFRNAPHRNYKDRNHKPELMVALSDFWLLHGFKEEHNLIKVLNERIELNFLIDIFKQKGYEGLYRQVMLMPQENVNEILSPLVKRVMALYQSGQLKKDSEDFWAAKAALNFCQNDNYDRGIFSIYFFNLLHLKNGEGIFQPEGLPHAYLEGQNIEVMANSDNVLRAGLTDKYIDVAELMKHVKFERTIPNVLKPLSETKKFSTSAKEFELVEYQLENKEINIQTNTAEIFLLVSGAVDVTSANEHLSLKKGEAFFVIANTQLLLKAKKEAHLFRVRVPQE